MINLEPKDGERMNTMKHDEEEYLDDVIPEQNILNHKTIGGGVLVMKNHYKLLDKLVQLVTQMVLV